MAAAEWWEAVENPPMETPETPVALFTAEQVADAVAAAIEAHAAGDDPREAARAAIAEVDPT